MLDRSAPKRVLTVSVAFQELGELQEAKQLLIQQKLELQGQVEAGQGALEKEQKEHQATRDSRSQREEQLLAQTKEARDQLVRLLPPHLVLNQQMKCYSLASPHSFCVVSFLRWQRSEPERSR